jgi:hypothetical protein
MGEGPRGIDGPRVTVDLPTRSFGKPRYFADHGATGYSGKLTFARLSSM